MTFSHNSYFLLQLQTIYLMIMICYLIISTFNLKSRFLSHNFDNLRIMIFISWVYLTTNIYFKLKPSSSLISSLAGRNKALFFCSGSRISAAQSHIISFHSLLWAEGFVLSRRTDWNSRPHRCRYFKHVVFTLHHSVFNGFLGIADITLQGLDIPVWLSAAGAAPRTVLFTQKNCGCYYSSNTRDRETQRREKNKLI